MVKDYYFTFKNGLPCRIEGEYDEDDQYFSISAIWVTVQGKDYDLISYFSKETVDYIVDRIHEEFK